MAAKLSCGTATSKGFAVKWGMSSTTNEGRYGLYSQGSTGWSTLRYEEFQEEDVWGILRGTVQQVNSSAGSINVFNQSSSSGIASRRRLSGAARMIIPKSSSSSNSSVIEPKIVQQHSAPVNIPDWSKIYGKKSSKKNTFWVDDEDDGSSDDVGVIINSGWDSQEEEEEDADGSSMMIPPHEWIARKLARSQISSFSVYEGVGRTLKGRDLKNVRNAILTKTGFLE